MKEITVSTDFIGKSYVLLNKLAKDSDFKTKLLNEFNKDAGFIKQSLILCENAQAAEDNYEKETKEADEAKKAFEKAFKTAGFNFTKHTAFLKLLLKYDIKKQLALGLSGREEPKNKEDWFVYALEVYDKIIGDSSAVALIGDYNFTLPDLQEGRQTIILAHDANDTLIKESSEAKEAMLQKDLSFTELYDRMQFIQLCAYYIFMGIPKKFKELGLPLIDNDSGALINVKTKDMVKDASIT